MKAVIYAGAALLFTASVYGVVDYYNTSNKAAFSVLYKDVEQESDPAVHEPIKTAAISPAATASPEPVNKASAAVVKKKSKPVVKKVRRVNFNNFSRGRIEEYISPEAMELFTPEPGTATPVAVVVPAPAETVVIEKATPVEEKPVVRRRLDLSKFSRAPLYIKKPLLKEKTVSTEQ